MRIAIYNRWLATLGGGERYTFALADALAAYGSVEVLTHQRVAPEDIADRLGVRGDAVAIRQVPDTLGNRHVSHLSADYDLFVNASHRDLFVARAPRNVQIVYFPLERPPVIGGSRWQRGLARLAGGLAVTVGRSKPGACSLGMEQALASYRSIWAISRFVQKWVHRRWHRPSELLYPPVDCSRLQVNAVKDDLILSVGRFFPGRHNKKHLALVEAFKKMCDGGLRNWQLHIAGGCQDQREHLDYLAGIARQVHGYPIALHANIGDAELRNLYARSKLFWHATGLDEDEESAPERCEHFGISTVEAMAAGCVPLVIAKGGQPEIVDDGRDGFLWRSLGELIDCTARLVANEPLRRQMAEEAVGGAARFDAAHFRGVVRGLVDLL